MTTLAVLGAGAKAVAVAAKAAALRDMGVDAPDVIAVERIAVAANWQASGGWTDGAQRLGTSPEKDVGFPYRSALVPRRNAELDERMTRYSWQSYLIATASFADWIDRGRPAPTHRRWGQYLRWVADQVGMSVVAGEVEQLALDGDRGDRWSLHTHESTVHADALMITGPGQAERSLLPGNPRVLSIAQFWHRAAAHDRITAERVAVIGGGESAASMLNELFRHRVSTITVISPQVTLFTRGESFFENALFSDPSDWGALTLAERRDALLRTDRPARRRPDPPPARPGRARGGPRRADPADVEHQPGQRKPRNGARLRPGDRRVRRRPAVVPDIVQPGRAGPAGAGSGGPADR
jgi:mycobactin lysine-N-oxygenase